MKAVFFHEHGGLHVLQAGELPTPEPASGEVLVRLRAAALNRLDLWVRQGWPGIKLIYPHIPGADGAGTVAALGAGVSGWEVGQRVVLNSNLSCGACPACLAGLDNQCRQWGLLGETRSGTYAEYVALPARNLLALPEDVDFHLAAAAALVYLTAWHSLIVRGGLRPGETVLVVGASGGVNLASIDIARFCGAEVIVVGSNAEKLALAASRGAAHLIDRSQDENWSKTVFQLTGRRGVDLVVDNVGATFPQSMRATRKGGRILTVGNSAGPQVEIDNRYMFAKHLTLVGSTMGTHNDFAAVMNLVLRGELNPALDRRYPLEEARQAQERLESGAQLGKITLEIP